MTASDRHLLILLNSAHETLKMENRLEKAGIAFRTISKPLSAGKDCGLALRIDAGDLAKALEIAEKNACTVRSVLERQNGGWVERNLSIERG